jgi:hypothetical protein
VPGSLHDGGYHGTKLVAGGGGGFVGERHAVLHDGNAWATQGCCRFWTHGKIPLDDGNSWPAWLLAFWRVLQLASTGREEEDDVADDHTLPSVGSTADLADHSEAEIADAEPGSFFRKDNVHGGGGGSWMTAPCRTINPLLQTCESLQFKLAPTA